jgi:hypothetical protein
MRALLVTWLTVACGATQLTHPPERERCWAEAKVKFQADTDRLCPGRFTECAHAAELIDTLRKDQEACP